MKLLTIIFTYFGRILIDGFDINKVQPKFVRRQIGIVPQDISYLMDNWTTFHFSRIPLMRLEAAKSYVP